jgi:hypothetical protein
VSHPILCLTTLQSDVFLLNSQPGLFTVAIGASSAKITLLRHLISRSYEVILPSSLGRVLSIAFPYSGYLPVSDYGTIGYKTHSGVFLGSTVSVTSPQAYLWLPIGSHPTFRRDYDLGRGHPTPHSLSLLRHSELITFIAGSGILTGYPSPTPFGLDLGSTNPGRINLPQETLDFRRYGFSP